MRALFCGLGSIGARHLKNLRALAAAQNISLWVGALRSGQRALPEEIAPLVDEEFASLPEGGKFDVAFVTNPTHLHAGTLKMLAGRVGTYFIEKPIFENAAYDLEAVGLPRQQKAYVAAPMRWCGVYGALKERLQGLPVYSVRAVCSSYLPDWRKGADYRKVYSAKRAEGGGVALDLIHEWDYLSDLFGLPQRTAAMMGRFSHLEIDSDDLAVYIARYDRFLCELHLDYFGRSYRRDVEVFTETGTLRADFGTGLLSLPDGSTVDCGEEPNRRYEREMEYFVEYALRGESESVNSPRHALEVLKLATASEL